MRKAIWIALFSTASCLSNALAQEGLVGHWSFNAARGRTVPDASGNANDGLVTYGKLVKGVDRTGFLFDDRMASVRVNSSPSLCPLEAVTVEAWVQLSQGSQSGYPSVVRKDGCYALRFSHNSIGFIFWTDGKFDILTAPKADWKAEQWYHLAGTYDGKQMRLYIDGALAAEKPHNGDIDAAYAQVHMGGRAGQYRLLGVIDEAKIYSRALTTDEINASRARGLATLAAQKHVEVEPKVVGKSQRSVFRKPTREIAMVQEGFIWIDAEDFQDYGGWLLDTQFVHLMGSAYLIAAGIGKPVKDATVEFDVARPGRYRLWVRAKNWIADYSPGQFKVAVNGRVADKVFGAARTEDWLWDSAGEFDLTPGKATISLHDLTGYYSRCDALVLTTDMGYTPPADVEKVKLERSRLAGLSLSPKVVGEWDVIVIGAGPAGCPAALAAARTGAKTALIQNRPVLGGNASIELGVPMNGAASAHPNARETGIPEEAGRLKARYGYLKMSEPFRVMAAREKNLSVFVNQHVFDVEMADSKTIAAVKAVNALTNEITVYKAKRFIDSTGDGWVAYFAKAEYRLGREARSEFDEDLAPEKSDKITMSGCLMGGALNYRAEDMGKPMDYTPPPWAAKLPPPEQFTRRPKHFRGGQWWMEHEGIIDDLWDAEKARDELIRIVFGYWNWIKHHSPFKDEARNYAIAHIPIVEAKRESRRIVGDYMVNQNDVLAGRVFDDRISYGGWPLDVHHAKGIFSGKEGAFHCNPRVPIWTVPYRSLYSRNIENLLMAGRCMSVTHIALGSVRVQNTLAATGQAVGTAAAMSLQFDTTPRGIYEHHMERLQQRLLKDDMYIPEIKNEDPLDLARNATVAASSSKDYEEFDRRSVDLDDLHPLNMPRAVMFPTGLHKRIDVMHLRLANQTGEPIEVSALLREAAESGDFSSKQDVAEAKATVPANAEKWVAFKFDATLRTPFAWVWLPAEAGLSWRLMASGPLGSCRAYGGEWSVIEGQYYSLYTEPPIATRVEGFNPENVINGWTRIIGEQPNMWASHTQQKFPQWIELSWTEPQKINSVYLSFDTDLSKRWCTVPMPRQCVRDYDVSVFNGGKWTQVASAKGNFQRRRIHRFDTVAANKLRLTVHATNGCDDARVFEMRVYNE